MLITVPRVSRARELFPDGFDIHLLHPGVDTQSQLLRNDVSALVEATKVSNPKQYDAMLQAAIRSRRYTHCFLSFLLFFFYQCFSCLFFSSFLFLLKSCTTSLASHPSPSTPCLAPNLTPQTMNPVSQTQPLYSSVFLPMFFLLTFFFSSSFFA